MSHPSIQRVPPLLLKDECNREDYVPKVVSIGPYHHGKPELELVESFKPKALDLFVSGGREQISFCHEKILEVISEVRKCYDEESTKAYTDHDLAHMMLLDACFILNHMDACIGKVDRLKSLKHQHLGRLIRRFQIRDLFLLENQIPFQIIKLLIEMRYEEDEGEDLINSYLNMIIFRERRRKHGGAFTPRGKEKEPLHLLDAFRLLVISDCTELEKTVVVTASPITDLETGIDPATCQSSCISRLLSSMHITKAYMRSTIKEVNKVDGVHSFRSVTDLKAKGIHFRPSPTESLMDVKFTSNFLYAELQLPVWFVSIYTKVFFLNIIAFEFSPNTPTRGQLTSYMHFMKSLIETPEDVKELRQQKILINLLGSDEEVFNVYKEMNTYGVGYKRIFRDVKEKTQSHYDSKRKTWIAELIHTYFRSPWTVLTFLAAFTLLCLSSIQTYYTVNPKSGK